MLLSTRRSGWHRVQRRNDRTCSPALIQPSLVVSEIGDGRTYKPFEVDPLLGPPLRYEPLAAMIGPLRGVPDMSPSFGASPKANTLPRASETQ